MIMHVMAAFDKKAKVFLPPYYSPKVAVAVRSFAEAANTPDHQVCKYAEDFSLHLLGTWDDETGLFQLTAAPTHVAEALALKKEKI